MAVELSHDQRIVACEQLAKDLTEKGWICRVWNSTKGVNPGAGVEVRKEEGGPVWASITVNKGGYVHFQRLWDELSTKQINKLGDDATYDGDLEVRPNEYTKTLPQEEMAGGRVSGLMQKLGFADTKTAAVAKKKNEEPPF